MNSHNYSLNLQSPCKKLQLGWTVKKLLLEEEEKANALCTKIPMDVDVPVFIEIQGMAEAPFLQWALAMFQFTW